MIHFTILLDRRKEPESSFVEIFLLFLKKCGYFSFICKHSLLFRNFSFRPFRQNLAVFSMPFFVLSDRWEIARFDVRDRILRNIQSIRSVLHIDSQLIYTTYSFWTRVEMLFLHRKIR